jgi:hypothetical protein
MYMDLLSDKLKKKLMKETDGVITEASTPSATVIPAESQSQSQSSGNSHKTGR